MLSQAKRVRVGDSRAAAAPTAPFSTPEVDRRGTSRERRNRDAMSQFLGSHQSKLDAKNRVSIPAPFRNALRLVPGSATPETTSLVLRPSHGSDCIEVWPTTVFHALEAALSRYDPLSESYDDFAIALYGDAFPAEADKEGRIVLSDDLKAHAHLTDSVTFIGLGRTFQIWRPELALVRRTRARDWAREQGMNKPPPEARP
jgi:MraZ protein